MTYSSLLSMNDSIHILHMIFIIVSWVVISYNFIIEFIPQCNTYFRQLFVSSLLIYEVKQEGILFWSTMWSMCTYFSCHCYCLFPPAFGDWWKTDLYLLWWWDLYIKPCTALKVRLANTTTYLSLLISILMSIVYLC